MRTYDLEIFCKNYLVGIYDGKEYTQYWNEDLDKIREYYEKHKEDIWVGHNSSNYDNILFKLILLGKSVEEIKAYSDAIITGSGEICLDGRTVLKIDNIGTNKMKRNLGLNKIQLYDWDILNDKVAYSLKQAEGYLGLPIYESNIDFTIQRALTDEEKEETEKYNRSDLYATWLEMKEQLQSIKIRAALLQEYNLPKSMISATNQKITGEILEGEYTHFTDKQAPYPKDLCPIEINNPEYHKAYELFTECEEIDYKSKLVIPMRDLDVHVAIGGLHGAKPKYHYIGEIWDVDVGSYYPNLMINFNLCSRAMKNADNFPKIVAKRLAIKKKVNSYLAEGRGDELTAVERAMPYGLKLVVNTVSGAMKAKFSKLYDERNNNWMCISGQLLLIDLIEKFEPYATIIQANTDGIFIIPHDKEACDREIQKWMDKTGLLLEKTIGKAIYQKDVNNYVFLKEDDEVVPRGAYVAQRYNDEHGLFQCRRNLDILDVGIVEYLVNNVDPHDTIYGKDWLLWKFQAVKKIGGMYKKSGYEIYGKVKEIPHRCNRIFAAKDKEKYGRLKKMKNGKETWDNLEGTPEHCWVNNGDIRGVHVSEVLDDLDLDWYVDEIKRKVCDFILETKERTRGKNYSLEEDWKRVQIKLGREIYDG